MSAPTIRLPNLKPDKLDRSGVSFIFRALCRGNGSRLRVPNVFAVISLFRPNGVGMIRCSRIANVWAGGGPTVPLSYNRVRVAVEFAHWGPSLLSGVLAQ